MVLSNIRKPILKRSLQLIPIPKICCNFQSKTPCYPIMCRNVNANKGFGRWDHIRICWQDNKWRNKPHLNLPFPNLAFPNLAFLNQGVLLMYLR